MLVKFVINGKLFAFNTNIEDVWQRIISLQVVKMCDFISIGPDIIKARSPNKYLMHVEINERYDRGEVVLLPCNNLNDSTLCIIAENNFNIKPDASRYHFSGHTIYEVFDKIYEHGVIYY